MDSNESYEFPFGAQKSSKAEDLDKISSFMDSILLNVKSYVHKIPLNNSSFLDKDNLHLMSLSNKIETFPNFKKSNKAVPNNKPNALDKKPNVKKGSQTQYRRSSSLLQNMAKKFTEMKNSCFSNTTQNSNVKSQIKSCINQNASPRKMQVVYKENDKFVSRSLSTMLKKVNAPAVFANKNRGRIISNSQSKKANNISRTATNIQPKMAKRICSVAKPINMTCNSPVKTLKNSGSIASNISKKSLLSNKRKSKDIMEKHIRRSKCNLRPMSQSSGLTYTTNRNNTRSASLNSKSTKNQSASSQNRPGSRRSRKGNRSETPQNKKRTENSKSDQTKTSSETNKVAPSTAQNQIKIPTVDQAQKTQNKEMEQTQIENQAPSQHLIQNQNLVNNDNKDEVQHSSQDLIMNHAQNQILNEIQNLIQSQAQNLVQNLNQSQNETKNQERCPSQPVSDAGSSRSESKPIKFMKNTENKNRHQIIANSNKEQGNPIKLINEKLEDLINKIKEEKDLIKSNMNINYNFKPNNNSAVFDSTNNNTNKANVVNNDNQTCIIDRNKEQTDTVNNNKQVISNNINNKVVNNKISKQQLISDNSKKIANNKNNNNQINTSKAVINNNINKNKSIKNTLTSQSKISNNVNNRNVIKVPSSVAPIVNTKFGSRSSRQSVQSHVQPKLSNFQQLNRLRSTMTPMELVQDYINLVNKAKRDRKTFTVCGNFYSIRKAFNDRGWVEKMRINMIDDPLFKKLENMSNFELVEGIMKDKDQADKYRRIFITKLLFGHQVDFYWDYMQNPFSVNNDRVKRTLINRFPFGATKAYTSKAGLCETLKEAYWYYIEGYSNILFPRTYNLANDEELGPFIDDFRRTAAISLLHWVTKNSNKPANIISPNGVISTSIFNFATLQCFNYLKTKEHKDIDEIIQMPREYEWDIFLEKYYKIVHQGQHFKENDDMNAALLIEQSRYILNKIRVYVPHVNVDGVMNLWLLKPNNGSRGCGIHVCRTLKHAIDTAHSRKETRYVIQKYIERPLLIHNTKFDIRQWFLVTCMPNLQVWLYKDCYLRFSSQIYDLSKLHESIHLTNNSVQCRYKAPHNRHGLPDHNMWHSDTFKQYLSDIGHPLAWKNIIYKGIKECLVGLFMLCQDKLITRVNSFELCGADFMVTEDFKPYLIEINSRPALYASTKITSHMCPRVLEDVVKVTIDYARNPRSGTGNFELIYKDTFNYIPPKNVNSIFVEGISHVKFASASLPKDPVDPCEITTIVSEPDPAGKSIETILHIDPHKVRKDVKNTLEKILSIIHTEKHTEQNEDGAEAEESPEDKNKQFKMMLSEFVDIITSVKTKQAEPQSQI